MTARFELLGRDDCPVAQGVALALARRRIFFRWEPGGPATVLRIIDIAGEGVHLRDPVAMLDWIDDLHPDASLTARPAGERALLEQARRLPGLIGAVVAARFPRDLDLAQHFLLEALLPFEAEPTANVAALLAPALWRLSLLDAEFGTHLLKAVPGLRGWLGVFLEAERGDRVLNPAAAGRFVAEVAASGGMIARGDHLEDWSRALGQGARVAAASVAR